MEPEVIPFFKKMTSGHWFLFIYRHKGVISHCSDQIFPLQFLRQFLKFFLVFWMKLCTFFSCYHYEKQYGLQSAKRDVSSFLRPRRTGISKVHVPLTADQERGFPKILFSSFLKIISWSLLSPEGHDTPLRLQQRKPSSWQNPPIMLVSVRECTDFLKRATMQRDV